MKANSIVAKVSWDLFFMQMKWALCFFPVILTIFFIVLHFVPDVQERNLSFISFIFQPAKGFMLVVAIISCFAFLTYYVKNGVTRKDYFVGSAIAAAGVAFGIIILSAVVTGILQLIGWFTVYSPPSAQLGFLASLSAWIIPLALSLIILCYYITGWIIGVGFYRFGTWGGMGFIAIGVLFLSFTDLLWEGEFSLPLATSVNLSFPDLSFPVSLGGTFILLTLGLWLIRHVTKDVPIKLG